MAKSILLALQRAPPSIRFDPFRAPPFPLQSPSLQRRTNRPCTMKPPCHEPSPGMHIPFAGAWNISFLGVRSAHPVRLLALPRHPSPVSFRLQGGSGSLGREGDLTDVRPFLGDGWLVPSPLPMGIYICTPEMRVIRANEEW